jgi:hypothetical protein
MDFEKCRGILLEETGLVQRIAVLQNAIREAVLNRDWTDFEGHFRALGEIGVEFTALEAERDRLFSEFSSELGLPAWFYAIVMHFPQEQRDEITSIYRNLKFETLKVQMSGEALMGYIAGARATMAGFFEIAFPDRGGKIYSPYGTPVSHDMRSMVLNHRF